MYGTKIIFILFGHIEILKNGARLKLFIMFDSKMELLFVQHVLLLYLQECVTDQ